MTKTWLIIEKMIGGLLTVWGLFVLYSITVTLAGFIHNGHVVMNQFTYLEILKHEHLKLLMSIAAEFGGFMLIFNSKPGWLLSIICSAAYCVTFFTSSRASGKDDTQTYYDFYRSYAMMSLLFLLVLILLIQKPFRKKYLATKKNWRWVIGTTLVLFIDMMLF